MDADEIQVAQDLDGVALYRTRTIEEFLAPGSNKFFIVARKGLGKTLLLKAKSRALREVDGALFHPRNELCEKLFRARVSDLDKFKDQASWDRVWDVCLHILVLQLHDFELPSELDHIFGSAGSLNDLLAVILDSRGAFDGTIYPYLATTLRPALRKVVQSPVVLFVDNVDEIFEPSDFRHAGPDVQDVFHQVWKSAQTAFLNSALRLFKNNRHVKTFSTIRLEALKGRDSANAVRDRDYMTELAYTKAELETIFLLNIERMRRNDLALPDCADPIERFLGVSNIVHSDVRRDDHAVSEGVFELVYRHTFERPRDIVFIGAELQRLDQRTEATIRECVRDAGSYLLGEYKNETIPLFRTQYYEEILGQIASNVVSAREMARINRNCRDTDPEYADAAAFLYRHGLLGYVAAGGGDPIQSFFVDRLTQASVRLPTSDYYILHPAVDGELLA
ncbi:MAG: hypothetical protein MJB57_04755, partial [Gemmatimonadetes bacterium]|nr:hypothetical protein [Gemmatimonadota bacterium]